MSPSPTPDSLIRSVMQGLQGVLDTAPGQETVPVPRAWVQRWLDVLGVVLPFADDPLPSGSVVVFVGGGVLGFLMGLAMCWLIC